MSSFDDILARATRRLRIDRELQWDVREELRAHLEDAAAEFREAGRPEDEADELAAKALGDPDEVAEQLWAANRGRIRLRAWGWWAVRTVTPAIMILAVYVLYTDLATLQLYNSISYPGEAADAAPPGPAAWAEARLRDRMTPTQRLIFFGDASAPTRLESQRGLRDAFPQEPLYQLNYIAHLLAERDTQRLIDRDRSAAMAVIEPELERGRRLDPDNGVYDLFEARLLLAGLSQREQDGQRNRRGEWYSFYETEPPPEITPDGIERGVAALQRAASKPRIDHGAVAMHHHRMEQLPPASSLWDHAYQAAQGDGLLWPVWREIRIITADAAAGAGVLAERGEARGAAALLDDLEDIIVKLVASDGTVYSVLNGCALQSVVQMRRVAIANAAGDAAAEAEAQARFDAMQQFYEDATARRVLPPEERLEWARRSAMLSWSAADGVDVSLIRRAEYAAADRGVLTMLALALIVLSLAVSGGGWLVAWWRRRRDHGPVLLWIGWRRLGWVLLAGVAAPLAAVGVLTATPWAGRHYNLAYAPQNAGIWAGAVVLVLVAVWLMGAAMLRRRAREIGLPTPPARRTRSWLIDLALPLLAVGVGGLAWWLEANRPSMQPHPWGVAGAWAVAVAGPVCLLVFFSRQLAWLRGRNDAGVIFALMSRVLGATAAIGILLYGFLRLLMRGSSPPWVLDVSIGFGLIIGLLWIVGWSIRQVVSTPFAASAVRSIGPVLAAGAMFIVLTLIPLLQWREQALVARSEDDTSAWIAPAISRPDVQLLRQWLLEGTRSGASVSPNE